MVSDRDIHEQLERAGLHIASAATQLVDMANEAGGRDNISVLIIRLAEAGDEPESWPARGGSDATLESASGIG